MKSILIQMMIATSLYVLAQVAMGHPVMNDVTLEDCLSDMVLDWEDPRCDQYRPEGDQEVAGIVIVYDPDEGTAKPVVVIE